MDLVLSTHNAGKVEQWRGLLSDTHIRSISTLKSLGIEETPLEGGHTFEANAVLKAQFAHSKVQERAGKFFCLGDDSGCCIDALGGSPGVFSARWAGEGVSGEQLTDYVLDQTKHLLPGMRGACFQCVVALVAPAGSVYIFTGEVRGTLLTEKRGTMIVDQPYSTIFVPDGYDKAWAEMELEQINATSHRGRAAQGVRKFFERMV